MNAPRDEILYELDPRLAKQPRWVKEMVRQLWYSRTDLQRSLKDLKRTSEDCDGRVVRGYDLAGAGEVLPSQDTYFFRIGSGKDDIISVRLDYEESRLYVSGGVSTLKIQPQAYNAFFIDGG